MRIKRKRVDEELALKAVGLVIVIAASLAIGVAAAKTFADQQAWLRQCAIATHGSLEREANGETIHSDSDGRVYGSTVNWHYYVRTGSGKRIEYGDDYFSEMGELRQ